jgi:hypothetical protein
MKKKRAILTTFVPSLIAKGNMMLPEIKGIMNDNAKRVV